MFAPEIRKRRIAGMKSSRWRWHLNEMFVKINGETSVSGAANGRFQLRSILRCSLSAFEKSRCSAATGSENRPLHGNPDAMCLSLRVVMSVSFKCYFGRIKPLNVRILAERPARSIVIDVEPFNAKQKFFDSSFASDRSRLLVCMVVFKILTL